MPLLNREVLSIRTEDDIVLVRKAVRRLAIELGLGLLDQTKIVTAASEIARNTFEYGGGGEAQIECHDEATRKRIRLVFEDHGPGIPDIAQAMRDGFTTGAGMGHGLGGSKRLVDHFEITSTPGVCTRIVLERFS